jgi:hypothetical protein
LELEKTRDTEREGGLKKRRERGNRIEMKEREREREREMENRKKGERDRKA